MNVVRHDDKVAKLVSIAVEEPHGILDDLCIRTVAQKTASEALVQLDLKTLTELFPVLFAKFGGQETEVGMLVFLDFDSMGSEPIIAPFNPTIHGLSGHGIGEPKGDEIGSAFLLPMGETASSAGDLGTLRDKRTK